MPLPWKWRRRPTTARCFRRFRKYPTILRAQKRKPPRALRTECHQVTRSSAHLNPRQQAAQIWRTRLTRCAAPKRVRLAIRRIKIPADGDIKGIKPLCQGECVAEFGLTQKRRPGLKISICDTPPSLFSRQSLAGIGREIVKKAAARKKRMADDAIAPVVENTRTARQSEIVVPEILLDQSGRNGVSPASAPHMSCKRGVNPCKRAAMPLGQPPGSPIPCLPSGIACQSCRSPCARQEHRCEDRGTQFATMAQGPRRMICSRRRVLAASQCSLKPPFKPALIKSHRLSSQRSDRATAEKHIVRQRRAGAAILRRARTEVLRNRL